MDENEDQINKLYADVKEIKNQVNASETARAIHSNDWGHLKEGLAIIQNTLSALNRKASDTEIKIALLDSHMQLTLKQVDDRLKKLEADAAESKISIWKLFGAALGGGGATIGVAELINKLIGG